MPPRSPLVAHGAIVAAVVKLDNPAPYKAALSRWEGRIILTIEAEPTTRSGKANAFMWVFLHRWAAMSETGYSAEELHEVEKQRWNGKTMVIDGEEMVVGQSTTRLSIQDFSVYLERMMVDAAHIDGFYLEPTPAEDWRV